MLKLSPVNQSKNKLDPSAGHFHPLHSVCLSVVESAKRFMSIVDDCDPKIKTIINHKLHEAGIMLLFYRTLIINNNDSKNNKLSQLIHYLQNKKCIRNIEKYKTPIVLSYRELCDRLSSILDDIYHRVVVCHLVEHQIEIEIQAKQTEHEQHNVDDDEDSAFVCVEFELNSNDSQQETQTQLKSTFECHITHEFEINNNIMNIMEHDVCEENKDMVQIQVALAQSAKCLLNHVEQYNNDKLHKCRALLIAYNPLQTVVSINYSLQNVTHPVHLYRAAMVQHFYPRDMLAMLWSEWMLIAKDCDDSDAVFNVVNSLAMLIEFKTKHDVILIPSSITLRRPFLSQKCQMIAPHHEVMVGFQTLLLYKGSLYHLMEDDTNEIYLNQLQIVLRHLHDNIEGSGVQIITLKWLNIGCGECFLQEINGTATQITIPHTNNARDYHMNFVNELQNVMFLNEIDCRIPFNQDIITQDKKCPICLSLQINPATIGNIECNHTFCKNCIEQWNTNRNNPKCPMCRKEVKHICVDSKKEIEMKQNIPMTIYQQMMEENDARCRRSSVIDEYYHDKEQQELYAAAHRNESLD